MPSIARPSPQQRRRRRSTKAETRERLIAAAVKLLHKGGESAVTTVSVTREAGITQSAFYQHFANVGDCLGVAADRACREIREAVENHRRRMLETRSEGGEDLERAYRDMFALAARQRPIMELFLRHRSDPLALGGAMYRLARGLSSDLGGRLAARAAREGIHDPPADLIENLADNLVAASMAAIEAFFEGRGASVEQSARLLAAFSRGACAAVLEALRKSTS